MNNLSWLYPIIIGAVAGWLAGLIKSGYGFGLLGNIVIGIIGSYIGGWLFGALGLPLGGGLLGTILTAVIGALVLLWIIGLVKRA